MKFLTEKKRSISLCRGVSLVEVMLGVIIFVIGFIPLLRLFSESGLSQQRMLRDFPVTLSISERVLMTIENEIEEGRFDAALFGGGSADGLDITETVLENREVCKAMENFYGEDSKNATRLFSHCRVLLSTKPSPDPDLIEITVKFFWNDRKTAGDKFAHNVVLHLLKKKI